MKAKNVPAVVENTRISKKAVVVTTCGQAAGSTGVQQISLRQANPKRVGSASHAHYARYKSASTLPEFLALGGSREDYKHDLGKGFITEH